MSAPAKIPPQQTEPIVYLKAHEVAERCSISIRTLYRKMNSGEFPSARQLSGNCVRWVEAEITAWQASRPTTVGV